MNKILTESERLQRNEYMRKYKAEHKGLPKPEIRLTPEEHLEKVLRPKYEFRGTTEPYQFCHGNGIEPPDWVKDCSRRYRKGQRAFSPYDCMKVAEAKLERGLL